MRKLAGYLEALRNVMLALLVVAIGYVGLRFPRDVDAPLSDAQLEQARRYYTAAYQPAAESAPAETEYETRYLRVARAAAEAYRVEQQVQQFVEQHQLQRRPVLEIGSGRGYLQDLAADYTGLDISPTVARFYHKKFVLGSATALPFSDDSFDGIWSIWVLEHVPNPEQMLREMRRVARDAAVLFLMPAWNVPPWAAQGTNVRPYSELALRDKLVKASIPLRSSPLTTVAVSIPKRLLRLAATAGGPTRLRYHRLSPNYETYWTNDSDAVNAIDRYEALLWFRSRGDECLNCDNGSRSALLYLGDGPLIIRVHKQPAD